MYVIINSNVFVTFIKSQILKVTKIALLFQKTEENFVVVQHLAIFLFLLLRSLQIVEAFET
jgi:hypothetical protein